MASVAQEAHLPALEHHRREEEKRVPCGVPLRRHSRRPRRRPRRRRDTKALPTATSAVRVLSAAPAATTAFGGT
jgi:hypothetical protein